MRFEDLRLAEPILRAVIAEGYTVPTPIQLKAIPYVLQGRDLMGCAQTGTGKTAAFALPILHLLSQKKHATHATATASAPAPAAHASHARTDHHPRNQHVRMQHTPARPVRALILSPTRELAAQIGDSFRAYGCHTGLRHACIFGGVNQNPQVRAIRDGVDILVATPGRLMDLMNQGFIDLSKIEIFVLDEADRMLDMGFIHDIRRIVVKLPPSTHRQTLFFSATMPGDIRNLAATILLDPVNVQVAAESATADRIDQCVYFVEKRNKSSLLIHLLSGTSFTRALVFTRTKHGADKVARQLHMADIPAEAIHGNKSQNARKRALENFRSGKTPVLIASDIAARGIDIDEISHVINYDLPNEPETYVHRIGRTARAGASGAAISFCDVEERSYLKNIERLTRIPIAVKTDQPAYAAQQPRPEHARPTQHTTTHEHPPRAHAPRTHAPRQNFSAPRPSSPAAPSAGQRASTHTPAAHPHSTHAPAARPQSTHAPATRPHSTHAPAAHPPAAQAPAAGGRPRFRGRRRPNPR